MRIAVVLASYNHAPWLRACIDSVLAQTRPPDRFIVVDDGSSDGSREIIESYGAALDATFQANRGTYATLNVGIARTDCDWIALHNSDDVWEPTKLARQEQIARECPEVGLIHTGVEYIDADGAPYPSPPGADLRGARWPTCGEMLPAMLRAMPVVISSVMLSRTCVETTGPFDERYLGMGDWDFCLRASERFPFGFAPEPLTRVRKHASSAGMDPTRLPTDWSHRDWALLAGETMPEAARRLYARSREGAIPRPEAAVALASLATLYQMNGKPGQARSLYGLAIRLAPLRLKTHLRLLATFLPAGGRTG